MITELSGFFRYSLSQKEIMDTFENEIIAIRNYFEIQKIRFEEKLVVQYDIDERCLPVKLPFFIVLPLIENAVKYGLQTSPIPLTINIVAKLDAHLEIMVQNSGSLIAGRSGNDGTNTGIENIRKRLELCYPGKYSFSLFERDARVIAQIIIRDLRCQQQEKKQ
jgi:LytS/YehU family sensor histidine kinase